MEDTSTAIKRPAVPRTAYQFPVYRWMGWLAVAGFATGLAMMFFLSGMFGVPAPIGWAFLVTVFISLAMLLDRPKLLLNLMLFYFMLMPSNRLFGLLGLPLPTFIDELFFLPFIAVIVMNWIQRRQIREATIFPLAFGIIAGLSWYVNGKPSPFTAVQVTLIVLKSYIIWYYCRLSCTFEDDRQLSRWVWVYILYALVQYPYNILWQRGPWPRFHPDHSGGVFGPDAAGGAHFVGYVSLLALLMLAGWWISMRSRVQPRKRFWIMLGAIVIAYNCIFMTDTKHALLIFPFAALPFVFHPKISARIRIGLLGAGLLFMLFVGVYFAFVIGGLQLRRTLVQMQESPKGEIMYAITVDFPHLVPYPVLGAGPGRFSSSQGVAARTWLARRYIIPEMEALRRSTLVRGNMGSLSGGSLLGAPISDFIALTGEFGWAGILTYYAFLAWVAWRLFCKSISLPLTNVRSGIYLSLCCCIIFLALVMTLVSITTVQVIAFPLWFIVGRAWDMVGRDPGDRDALDSESPEPA